MGKENTLCKALGPLPDPLCNLPSHWLQPVRDYAAQQVAAERESIAQWLEGQGQPGYAHEVRHRA